MTYRRTLLSVLAVLFLIGMQFRPPARLAAEPGAKAAALVPVAGKKPQAKNDPALVPGVPVAGELAAGRKDYFTIAAESNQLLAVTIAPMDMDFALRLYAPEGRKIAECGKRYFGPTPLSAVTSKAGIHRVEIGLPANFDAPVRYEIKLEQQRGAIAQDQIRLAAEAAIRAADAVRDKAEAMPKWEDALSRFSELGDRREEAYALTGIAWVHYYQSQYQLAFQRGGEAMAIWQSLNDPLGQAETLFLIGLAKYETGQITPGMNDCQAAMDLWRSSNSLSGQASGIVAQGVFYKQTGDYQSAITLSSQARDIYVQLRDKGREAKALKALASAYLKIGYYQNAADISRQALALAEQTMMPLERKLAHGLLGESLLGQGEPSAALAEFNQELALFEPNDDARVKAYTFGRFGQAHAALDDRPKALEYYQQALDLHRHAGNRQGEADTLNRMGVLMEQGGQRQAALDLYQRALPMSHSAAYSAGEISTLRNLARVQRDFGKLDDAYKNVQQAIDLIEATRQRTGGQQQRSSYLATMQESYSIRVDLLMRQRQQQLALAASGKPEALEAAARLSLEALQASDQARARTLLESVTEARAELRKDIPSDLLKREQDLQRHLNLKSEQQMSLFDGSVKTPEAARRQKADGIAEELRALNVEYDQLQEQIRRAMPRYAELTKPPVLTGDQIKGLLDDQTVLLVYSLGDNRSYLWAVTKDSLESYLLPPRREIEGKARNAYYWLTATERLDQSNLERFFQQVKQADAKYWREAAVLSQMLLGPVAERISQKKLLIVGEGALQRLSFAALPEPQTGRQGNKRIGGSGDGENGGSRNGQMVGVRSNPPVSLSSRSSSLLVANHEIVYLPSISVLAAINKDRGARQPAPKMLALYADPIFSRDDARLPADQTPLDNSLPNAAGKSAAVPVPEGLQQSLREMRLPGINLELRRLQGTKIEAEYIASFVNTNSRLVAMNANASVNSVKAADLTQYRLLHFATHGLINNENPELSGLVLSLFDERGQRQNGFLRMHEIYNLKLNADVVILSSCESAGGKEIGGEGLMALSRGFFYAGTPRVVASLWAADDRATPLLMREFYHQLIEMHASPAAALKAAQVAVQKRPQFRSPYYWAGFVLQGDYK
ncbi:MAG: CHAT domain-containing protein [Acidobacteriota bacterium]|nr:CHAT domain-containing protein [Acidobacteriota bacterium]